MIFMLSKLNKKIFLSFTFACFLFVIGSGQTITPETKIPALKDVFKNDFTIGCLLSYAHIGFESDPAVPGQSEIAVPTGGKLIQYHMNSMSPGNWMKSAYIVDMESSVMEYEAADSQKEKDYINEHPKVKFNGNIIAQLNWAARQGFTFRGHTLVWHNQTPGTAFFRSGYTKDGARLSKKQMTKRLENYIKEVIRIIHEGWPGLLTAMDVVNEAVNENGTDRTGSQWYQTFGDNSYVMKSFEFARKYTEEYGETQMKLYYNDYGTHVPAKADGIARLCKPIFKAGYLDGIGMQQHDSTSAPTASQWIDSYNKFDAICTEMSVTELDISPVESPPISGLQANQYAMLFKCYLDRSSFSGRGKIINVSKDGLNDKWAFRKNASLWDEENQPKPAFFAIVKLAENYHAIDSLFTDTTTLDEKNYTRESWQKFTTALASAKEAMEKNYSQYFPATDILSKEKANLEAAIDNLVEK
ncbi:MAG: endo-1,4-beta-xylanase [Spirochaetales bacterium]|nr:endo-1,4-beta-xylanase [Spirochaetales bacterium]